MDPADEPPGITPHDLTNPEGAVVHLAVTAHGGLDPSTLPNDFSPVSTLFRGRRVTASCGLPARPQRVGVTGNRSPEIPPSPRMRQNRP